MPADVVVVCVENEHETVMPFCVNGGGAVNSGAAVPGSPLTLDVVAGVEKGCTECVELSGHGHGTNT